MENKTLYPQTAFDEARALDTVQKTSETYNSNCPASAAVTASLVPEEYKNEDETGEGYAASTIYVLLNVSFVAIDHIFVQYVIQEKLFVTNVRRDIIREFVILVPRLTIILNCL